MLYLNDIRDITIITVKGAGLQDISISEACLEIMCSMKMFAKKINITNIPQD